MNRYRLSLVCSAVAAVSGLSAAPLEIKIPAANVDELKISCAESGSWKFSYARKSLADGVDELLIEANNATASKLPAFKVSWNLPQNDIQQVRAPHRSTPYAIQPDYWVGGYTTDIAHWSPIAALLNDRNANRFTFACSEAKRKVRYHAGLNEEACVFKCHMTFGTGIEAPADSYSVKIRLDSRQVFWSEAVREAADWISSQNDTAANVAPDAAFKPLYSTWYCFHQDVFDKDREEECRMAARFGIKTLIVDDGWQTDDTKRGYAFCGDWQVSKRRFPDMASHVRRVQDMGIKYMVWYSVPFIGRKSAAYERFKGKFLYESMAGVLDPRFPENREYLISIYEKALREWNLDGFKFDFIDSFALSGPDPAEKDGYAGRDIKSVEAAVDRLMSDAMKRLKAIKPEILIEFRQAYIGSSILKYGNMFRVGDCPGDKMTNRRGIANLRLTSGKLAVHGDMLEWHPSEKVEVAARAVLDSLFGVVQYSMMLRNLPADHLAMVHHWAEFSSRHEDALLHGSFRPYNPEHGFPVLVGESAAERIIGAYLSGFMVDCLAADRRTYVINATGEDKLLLKLAASPKTVKAFDTLGNETKPPALNAGINEVPVPAAGYLCIEF